MPDDRRIKRIESFFRDELSRLVSRELDNPIFVNVIISFPEIKVSRDLSNADVLVSVFGDGSKLTEIVKALNDAAAFIRREIMRVTELRKTPVFKFHEDRTMETASRIDGILNMLDIPPEPDDSELS
jgi:ribosome-binding factor A